MRLREMKRYRREDGHSYALGTFCVLELLRRRPEQALRVVLDPTAVDSSGGRLVAAEAARLGVPLDVDAKVPAALARKGNVHTVAAFTKFDSPVRAEADHVVLVRPADFGNLGTVVRTITGLGCPDLVLVPPAADLLDPQVVRASMGSVFVLRWTVAEDLTAYGQRFPRPVYAFRGDAGTTVTAAAFETPCALVFGPESSGLLPDDAPGARPLALPQAAGIDSFNLAISVALGLWELRRQTGTLPTD